MSLACSSILIVNMTLRDYRIMNSDSVIEYYFYAIFSIFSFLIKALALLFNRLYLSKASQASLLSLNDFYIYFPVLINL